MTYGHAIVWLDHREATVIDYTVDDRHTVHVVNEDAPKRIHRKSGYPGTGKEGDTKAFFDEIAAALTGAEEILLAGPGVAKVEFQKHLEARHPMIARLVVGTEPLDHPSDGQLLAFAKRYFKRVDALRGDA